MKAINEKISHLSGLLLSWSSPKTISRNDLLSCESLKFNDEVEGTKWEEYSFKSNHPLRGEDERSQTPPYFYKIICRRSGARLLLLSSTRQIIDHLVENELNYSLKLPLHRVQIAVDTLVKDITVSPEAYVLTFVHARTPAFGSPLRSVSFYGDNIAEASFFRDYIDLMNVFTCGIRNITSNGELVRLGNDGIISFYSSYASNPHQLTEIENVLSYLSKKRYLDSNTNRIN
jgi:hypothetical protein